MSLDANAQTGAKPKLTFILYPVSDLCHGVCHMCMCVID